MPQTARQLTKDSSQDYTAVDPRQNPIAFIYQNRDAIARMPEDKQLKFIDMAFRRFALPRYQQVNKGMPLSAEETEKLRLAFAARMLGIEGGKIELGGPEVKHGALAKTGAALEAGGAGVLGGIRTISDLAKKINEHLGPIGAPGRYVYGKISKGAGVAEGRAYESAKEVSPTIASVGAGVGHQIPAMIAAEGIGSAIPGVAKTAPLAMRALSGAARGTVEGAAYGASVPGGDAQSYASWGAALGAAFPILGRFFGLGRRAGKAIEGAASVRASTEAAPKVAESASKTMGDLAEIISQKKFGKAFRDLSPTERAQVPQGVKEEIQSQAAAKKATSEAKKAALRQGKAEAAKAKAVEQAAQRKAGVPTPKPASQTIKQATAAQAATENPSTVKLTGRVPPEATGPKIRAKGGKPASPAQQAADRERIATKRAGAKSEEFGAALEKKAQELAGRYTSATQVGVQHIPELEEAVRDIEGGDVILSGLQKLRRAKKITDEIYADSLKEWLVNQFGEE